MNQPENDADRPLETTVFAHGLALAFVMLFPTLATWIYFVQLSGHPAMRVAFALGKIIQFGFPLFWFLCIQRRRLVLAAPTTRGICEGLAFGLLAGAAIFLVYGSLRPYGLFVGAKPAIAEKLADFHATTPATFAMLALFISVPHSLLEEYYWRWFVYGQTRRVLPTIIANIVAAVGFTLHHIILLRIYLTDWSLTALCSFGIFIGGVYWAWLYQRARHLYAPWLSHFIVDAVLMWIGYDMVWGTAEFGE